MILKYFGFTANVSLNNVEKHAELV